MKKSTITIILLAICILLGFLYIIKLQLQIDNYKEIASNNRDKYSKLLSEKDRITSCFSAQISSTETCLLNCHTLTCYQGCPISNNDILSKCS